MKKYLRETIIVTFLLITFSASAEEIKDGLGEASLPDSSVYKGEFKNGRFNGRGVLVWREGTIYEGEFKDGLMHGKGVFIYRTGDKYEGEFKDGRYHGIGTIIYTNGDRYDGEFKDGLMDGQGVSVNRSGDKYEGEFQNGKIEGKGTLIYHTGDRYEGEFRDGYLNGKGIITRNTGESYEGDIKDNSPHGKGVFIYATGAKYEGEFKNGIFDGKGSVIYASGERYKGEFKNWKFNGKGTFIYTNGDKYQGDFLNNLFYGRGVLIRSDGSKEEGVFIDGKFVGQLDLEKEFKGKIKSGRFLVFCYPTEMDYANRVALFFEDFLGFISKDFGMNTQFEYPITVVVLPNQTAYNKFLLEKMKESNPRSFGRYYDNLKMIVTYAQSGWGTIAHEIIHPIIARNYSYMPAWGQEGIPAFFEKFYGYIDEKGALKIVWGFQNPWRIKELEESLLNLNLTPAAKEIGFGNEQNQSVERLVSIFLYKQKKLSRFLKLVEQNERLGYSSFLEAAFEKKFNEIESLWKEYLNDIYINRKKIYQLPMSMVFPNKKEFIKTIQE